MLNEDDEVLRAKAASCGVSRRLLYNGFFTRAELAELVAANEPEVYFPPPALQCDDTLQFNVAMLDVEGHKAQSWARTAHENRESAYAAQVSRSAGQSPHLCDLHPATACWRCAASGCCTSRAGSIAGSTRCIQTNHLRVRYYQALTALQASMMQRSAAASDAWRAVAAAEAPVQLVPGCASTQLTHVACR